MRRLPLIIAAGLGGILLLALIVPALIPTEVYRDRIENAAYQALGREVQVQGPIRFSILPRVQASAGDVTIANAEGFGENPFADMDQLRLSLKLFPLLAGRIEVDEFILVEPRISLEQAGGRNNWTFSGPDDAVDAPVPVPVSTGGFRRPGAIPLDASLGDVRLINGLLHYDDRDTVFTLSEVYLDLDLPTLDSPFNLDGTFLANERPMSIEIGIGSFREFFEGQETPLDFSLNGALGEIGFEGFALESSELELSGNASVDLLLREIADFLGSPVAEGETFQRFAATTAITAVPGQITLNDADITFDNIQASGNLDLNYVDRPFVTGALIIPDLNLNPYIIAERSTQSGPSRNTGIGPWSESSVDLTPLALVDSSLSASVGRLTANDIEVTDADMTIEVNNDRMVAQLNRFILYGGEGRASAVANVRNADPSFSIDASLGALQALPFLRDAAKFERLRGLGTMELDLLATGSSPAAIMSSLNGQGRFEFTEGAIVGANLPQIIRTVQSALETRQLPSGFGEEQETDFSVLNGTFDVTDGVAENLDMQMLSPLLRVTGQGQVNMAEQTLSYRLNPRAVQSLVGQGGDLDLQGVEVPILIQGNFNNVSIGLDYEAIVRSLLRRNAGDLIGGDLGNALGQGQSLEEAAGNALLDAIGGRDEEAEDGEDTEEDPARTLLRGILGGNQPAEEEDDTTTEEDGTDGR